MLLMGAYQQAGGEGIKTILKSSLRCLSQPKLKTVLAAVSLIAIDIPEVFCYIAAIDYPQGEVHDFRQ
jgi:hypothetical protein